MKSADRRRANSGGAAPTARDGFDVGLDDYQTAALAAFRAVSPVHTAASWAAFVEYVLPGIQAHDRAAAEELQANYHLEPFPEAALDALLGGINVVVTGKQDSIVGWQDQIELSDHYHHQTYVAVDGAGHNVHLDQPALIGQLIRRWLSDLLS